MTDSQSVSISCHKPGEMSFTSPVHVTKYVLVGVAAVLALISIYITVVTLTQGFKHALEQSASLWVWIAPLAIGLGIQAALFSYIRDGSRERKMAATASVTASGGVSTGSMLACCAHHLSDVLPILGITGLTVFMAQYQKVFLLAGILSNIVGITIMLEAAQHISLPGSHLLHRWNMKYVKRWALGLSLAVMIGVFFIKFLL